MSDEILPQEERQEVYARGRDAVERFVGRFEPSYRLLAYHAALPLVLTPDLLGYLRTKFLQGQVPWVAEADLLLSELCQPAGYERYTMDPAVRAYLLREMQKEPGLGRAWMQEVARLLIHYVRHLFRTNPFLGEHELQSQQWAAMVYLDEHRETAVREIAEAFQACIGPAAEARAGQRTIDQVEMARLARIAQDLIPGLEMYPELIEYARNVWRLLGSSTSVDMAVLLLTGQANETIRVLDTDLPALSALVSGRMGLEPVPPDKRRGTGRDMSLEIAILTILYDIFESRPGSFRMTLSELYAALGAPSDERRRDTVIALFLLRERQWVEYQILADGSSGLVWITFEGVRVARNPQSLDVYTEVPKGKDTSIPCPATLEELIQVHPLVARLTQRDELVQKITEYFTPTPGRGSNYMVIYGQPLVGKTRFLMRLKELLDDQYVALLVTWQGLMLSSDDPDVFAFDLAAQLTNMFSQWAKRHGVQTMEPLNYDEFKGRGRQAFFAYWDRLRRVAGTHKPLVIFDEVERILDISEQLAPKILAFLDEFVRNPENGYFILSGSERVHFSSNERFSLLIAGAGLAVRIGYYDQETVRSIFSTVQDYFVLEEDVLEYLLSLCDGHPRLVRAMVNTLLSLVIGSPGKREVGKGDIEAIVIDFMEHVADSLWALLQRLSREEFTVVWLLGKKVLALSSRQDYYLKELVELANEQLPGAAADRRDLIERGIVELQAREWVEWKDRESGLFRFKLGVLPLWVNRYHISYNWNDPVR